MVEGDRLEICCGASHREFESPPLRHTEKPGSCCRAFLFCNSRGDTKRSECCLDVRKAARDGRVSERRGAYAGTLRVAPDGAFFFESCLCGGARTYYQIRKSFCRLPQWGFAVGREHARRDFIRFGFVRKGQHVSTVLKTCRITNRSSVQSQPGHTDFFRKFGSSLLRPIGKSRTFCCRQ